MKITIDNKEIEIPEGTTILKAATDANITIPTLCFNEELTPTGSCRICVVEVIKDGKSLMVSACDTVATEGIVVYTKSEKALNSRRFAVSIIYSMNPNIPAVQKLAKELGIDKDVKLPESECINCGRCVKICKDVVERSAINRTICGLSYGNDQPSLSWNFDKCIACGSCAFACPTHAIRIEDKNGVRTLITPNSRHEFSMKKCAKCGSYFEPNVQVDFMIEKTGLPAEKFDCCMNCR